MTTDIQNGRRATDQEQNEELAKLSKDIKDLQDIMRPIAETYRTVSALGKWSMAGLVFLSVLIGILLGIRNLFR